MGASQVELEPVGAAAAQSIQREAVALDGSTSSQSLFDEHANYKGLLQELIMGLPGTSKSVKYTCVSCVGGFCATVTLALNGTQHPGLVGHRKKGAEQSAAHVALQHLQQHAICCPGIAP